MNGKKAKMLRKHVQELTVGQPDRNLIFQSPMSRTLINDPKSTRGVYRKVKKAYKQGAL